MNNSNDNIDSGKNSDNIGVRLDTLADIKRYNDDLWTYGDLYGDYIPERGEDWHPDWGSSVQYDAPEPTWDAVSRHDMNEGW